METFAGCVCFCGMKLINSDCTLSFSCLGGNENIHFPFFGLGYDNRNDASNQFGSCECSYKRATKMKIKYDF